MGAPVWNRLDFKADNLLSSNTHNDDGIINQFTAHSFQFDKGIIAIEGFFIQYSLMIFTTYVSVSQQDGYRVCREIGQYLYKKNMTTLYDQTHTYIIWKKNEGHQIVSQTYTVIDQRLNDSTRVVCPHWPSDACISVCVSIV